MSASIILVPLKGFAVFVAVKLGTTRLSSELQLADTPNDLMQTWQLYRDALDRATQAPTSANADTLRSAIDTWQVTLISAACLIDSR